MKTTHKSTYSLRVDPVKSPLSLLLDTRHCFNSIEKPLPAKQNARLYVLTDKQRLHSIVALRITLKRVNTAVFIYRQSAMIHEEQN